MEVKSIAASDFSRARNKAMLSGILHLMNAEGNKLLSFDDVKEILKPRNQAYMGSRVVPLNLIVGSEGRYRDFNKYFLPKADHLRNRWERVDEAHLKDIILPAIQLYEIGGVYFVRDGNHRVSVAKAQGVEFIDAEVISLASEITIKPGMTSEQLRETLIAYEKKVFYDNTKFGELTGDLSLDFSTPGRYDVICNHILVHKYYQNESKDEEIPFSEALVSWYNTVYRPAVAIIRDQWLLANFPGRTEGDLYVWIVKHWDFLKKRYGGYSLADAARDFSQKYGQSKGKFLRFFALLAGKIFRKKGSPPNGGSGNNHSERKR